MFHKRTLSVLIGCALAAHAEAAIQKSPENSIMPSGTSVSRLEAEVVLPGTTCSGSGGTGCPSEIADNGSGSSSMDIGGCGAVSDVNVGLDVTHSWVGDLAFTLTSPEGTSVTILDRPGVPATTFGCSGDDIAAVFDDDASVTAEDMCNNLPAISGDVIPNNPLSAFDSQIADGEWTLGFEDLAGGDSGTLNDWSLDIGCVPTDRAAFKVSKEFTDGNPAEVEVTLICNSGSPLEQHFTIAGGGPGVTFVVTDIPESGAVCEVTESGGPAGYTAELSGTGGDGCSWGDVTTGLYTCDITNTPAPVDVEITKEWVFENGSGGDIDTRFSLSLECDAPILGDSEFYGDGDEVFTTQVVPSYLGNTCSVEETLFDESIVVTDNGCSEFQISPDSGNSCTITNTVFYEGIPTLSDYGIAILALSMLGLGIIGYRRFI
ncbi:MAG: proprotein convertase P-domain-containing protein [Lysobacterales bacterium]|jgi:subtilisin-like proprotein convertase family protein